MSPPIAGKKEASSPMGRLLGSTTAGVTELLIFHPIDTTAKRLMANTGEWRGNLGKIIFRDTANASVMKKYFSLFPGLGFAAIYKISQRIYKFGGQPFVYDYLDKHASTYVEEWVGKKQGRPVLHAIAGSIIGVGEIVLLPFDVLKIKLQTAPETVAGRSFFSILRAEGITRLYAGAGWTAARNAPGSFALFGGSAITKDALFKLEKHSDATLYQNFVASAVGGTCSIAVSSPLDVVKTRIQNKPFDSPEGGFKIIGKLLKNEGPLALFKGLTPKLIAVGPKLVFSFTVAQSTIAWFSKNLGK